MKNLKKIARTDLKTIKAGAGPCTGCPPVPYGRALPQSCEAYYTLPACCKSRVLVSADCFGQEVPN